MNHTAIKCLLVYGKFWVLHADPLKYISTITSCETVMLACAIELYAAISVKITKRAIITKYVLFTSEKHLRTASKLSLRNSSYVEKHRTKLFYKVISDDWKVERHTIVC